MEQVPAVFREQVRAHLVKRYKWFSVETKDADKFGQDRDPADAHLLEVAVEEWVKVLPWLKYTSRNERVLTAALKKRDERTLSVCLHMLVLNRARREDRLLGTSRRSCLLLMWCTWMRKALETKNKQHIFRCVQMRAASRQVNRACASKMMDHEFRKSTSVHFGVWSQLIRRRRRMLRCCKDLARRWHTGLVASKFRWWVHAFVNWMELRESVGNLFQRVTFRLSSHIFLEWSGLIHENRRLLVVGVKALTRWNHLLLRHALIEMMVNAKSNRRIMAAFSAVSSRRRGKGIAFCFRQLKDKACDRGALRNMKVKALMLWTRSMREKFLLRWWDNVHETHRLTYAMSKAKHLHMTGKISLSTSITLRNVHRLVCFAMQHWCGVVKMLVMVRNTIGMWDKTRKDKLVRECVRSWLQVAKEVKRQVKIALGLIFRSERTFLLVLLDQWCTITVRHRKHAGWANFKNQQCVRRAGREMMQSWRAHIQLQRAVGRLSWKSASSGGMGKRKLAFEKWKRIFAYYKNSILTVARALTRRQLKDTGECFNVWFETLRRARQVLRLWIVSESKRDSRKLVDGFFLWRAYATAQKRLVVAAAKVISRRDLIAIAGYFYWLARLTDKWKHISIWCDKIERSSIRKAFCLWCDERIRCLQKERKWHFTAFKMMQGLLKRCFDHWRATHIETNLHRCTVKKWAIRMGVHVLTAPWFYHWVGLIRQRNLLNRTLRLGQQRAKPMCMAKYYQIWQKRAEYRRMVWSVSRRIKIRWFAMVGTQAFYIWRRYLSNKANCMALLHHVAIHRHFHFCASFFYVWEEQVNEGKTIVLARFKSEASEKSDELATLNERLQAAEHLARLTVTEKQALADELSVAREECAAAYRVIEALNVSEQGSKSRIDNLVSRLDEASYTYDRLEETQSVVKELQTLRRTSTDEINRLQLEWDVCKAEKEGIALELEQRREMKLTQSNEELAKMKKEMETNKGQADNSTAQFLIKSLAMDRMLVKLDQDLRQITVEYKSGSVTASNDNAVSKEVQKSLEHQNRSLDAILKTSKRENGELKVRISVLEESVASEKRRILGLILPQDPDAGKKESVLLVLNMHLSDIKAKELDFIDEVAAHVSNALNCHDAGWVTVTSLQSGSIKARLWFGPGPSSSGLMPLDAVDIVKTQVSRPGSMLLTGSLGSKVKSVELPALSNQTISSLDDGQLDSCISGDGDAVIAIATKSPARVTRATPPPGEKRSPARRGPESLHTHPAASLSEYSGLGKSDAVLTDASMAYVSLKLGLDFRVAGTEGSNQRAVFESNVAKDLAHASGLSPSNFNIKKISPGSVVVELEIPSCPAVTDPMAVAAHLESQVSDPNSSLRNGATTRYTTHVTAHHVIALTQPSSQGILQKGSKSPAVEEQGHEVTTKDTSFESNFSSLTMQDIDALELLASERAMRERIFALESLMTEKDGLIQALAEKSQSSEPLRKEIRELTRILQEKDVESRFLKARLQNLETENSRISPEVHNASPARNAQNSLAAHGLLLTSRNLASLTSVPASSDQSPTFAHTTPTAVRSTPPAADTSAAMMRADSEQLLQFQSTLRKAEAALAEQSRIVEGQVSDLVEAQRTIESAGKQKKVSQAKLEHALADLAEQKDIADSVTLQVHKMSQKNAELTKEITMMRRTVEESAQMHDRLRKELEIALNTQRQAGNVSQTSRGDLFLEIDAQRNRAADLSAELNDVNKQLDHSMEARSKQHEGAVLERQKLQQEMKDTVDRQQLVIDRLMQIIDTHRQRRNNARDCDSDEQIDELKLRASAAESAAQQSMSKYQTLQIEIKQLEEETRQLKQALEASLQGNMLEGNILEGNTSGAQAHQRELNESLIMMRVKTRWECLGRVQELQLKRREIKLLDLTFSSWANQTEEMQFEKLLGDESRNVDRDVDSSLEHDPTVMHSELGQVVLSSTVGPNSSASASASKYSSAISSLEKPATSQSLLIPFPEIQPVATSGAPVDRTSQ